MTAADLLVQAVQSGRGVVAADALCQVCVELLGVDAAAVSLVFDGLNSGTLGTSGADASRFDEVQFTMGQGPCLDAVNGRGPVLVPELDDTGDARWPAYRTAMLEHRVHGVFAFPVVVAGEYVAALDLFRAAPGPLSAQQLSTAVLAAELAAVPVLDVAASDWGSAIDPHHPQWSELQHLTRVEVAQATGMLVGQLDIDSVQALARLRAHAYATGRSTTDVARDIISRVLKLDPDPDPDPDPDQGSDPELGPRRG